MTYWFTHEKNTINQVAGPLAIWNGVRHRDIALQTTKEMSLGNLSETSIRPGARRVQIAQ